MKILIHGPAFWAKSAYGKQIKLLIDALQNLGVAEIAQSVTYGLMGRAFELNGVLMLPADGRDAWGNSSVIEHYNYYQPDVVLSLGDVFGLDPVVWSQLPWVPWVTVDSEPLWPDIVTALQASKRPLMAYSRYGRDVLQRAGFDATYVPLAYDPEEFYPVDQAEARARINLPADRFVVLMVQANRHHDNRKNWDGQLTAFADFKRQHPEAFLFMHTCRNSARGGYELDWLLKELGLVEGQDFAFSDQYTETLAGASDTVMRDLYNASDVLLEATKAEGFGVPMLEALACGVPTIYTDFGASREVGVGYPVAYEREWCWAGSWWCRPDRESIVNALGNALTQTGERDRGALVSEVAHYRLDNVTATYWRDVVENWERELA